MGIPQSNRRRSAARAAKEPEAYAYDPSEHNIATVMSYVQEHPDMRESVLAAELASAKPRTTLIAQLQAEQE